MLRLEVLQRRAPRFDCVLAAERSGQRFLERRRALADPELIRTKVNLIPESVTNIGVVDIVWLDRQA